MAVDDRSGGVKQLSTWTDIDVTLPVEDKIGAAEGAVGASRLVPDRDVRGYITVHQPLEQPDRAISRVPRRQLLQRGDHSMPHAPPAERHSSFGSEKAFDRPVTRACRRR